MASRRKRDRGSKPSRPGKAGRAPARAGKPRGLGPTTLTLELHPDALLDDDAMREAIAHAGGWTSDAGFAWRLLRRAIDARRSKVRIRAEVEIWPGGEAPPLPSPVPLALPTLGGAVEVAIVGAGPAGMFCAWQLARHGIRARIFERGKAIRDRR